MSNNTFKVLSKTSMAAILAASALVPAAVASADNTAATKIEKVAFEHEGKLVTLSMAEYTKALMKGTLDASQPIQYVIGDNTEAYAMSDYTKAYLKSDENVKDTFEKLKAEDKSAKGLEVTEGKIVDGKVVGDETPEEKVNETFFYNLAA